MKYLHLQTECYRQNALGIIRFISFPPQISLSNLNQKNRIFDFKFCHLDPLWVSLTFLAFFKKNYFNYCSPENVFVFCAE